MIDIKYLIDNPEARERLRLRDPSIDLGEMKNLYDSKRKYTRSVDELRAERNRISKQYGLSSNPSLLKEAEDIKFKVKNLEDELKDVEEKLYEIAVNLPNIPHYSVPQEEKIIASGGEEITLDFEPEDHISLGKNLSLFDFEAGSKIASQKFVVYTDLGAELEYALQNYFLDYVRNEGFSMVIPPLLANEKVLFTSGQFPKFRDQVYETLDSLLLIPTVEVSLVALHMDEIISAKKLPIKYTSLTPNFRREAGAAGKRDMGLIRMHQYSAVEMVIFDAPERSYESLEEMTNIATNIVRELRLPYRVKLLSVSDLAQQSAKTYDIEVFLPSQKKYYEVSSCSNCEEYQSRRGNIKFRDDKGESKYVHTLNGTALATSRVLPAILENNQQKDGSVIIPKELRKYFSGREIIEPK